MENLLPMEIKSDCLIKCLKNLTSFNSHILPKLIQSADLHCSLLYLNQNLKLILVLIDTINQVKNSSTLLTYILLTSTVPY